MRTVRLAVCLLLWAQAAQALTVKLAWDAPTTGDTPAGYIMYKKIGQQGQYELLATIPAPTLTYTDTTATVGEQCYIATSYNAGGESAPSNAVCFQGLAPPGPPQALRIVP